MAHHLGGSLMRLFSGNIGAGISAHSRWYQLFKDLEWLKVCRKNKPASLQISQLLYQLKISQRQIFTFEGIQMAILPCLANFRRGCVTGSVLC